MSDSYAPRVRILYNSAQAVFEESINFDLLGADQARWIEQTRGYCDRLSPFTTQNQFPRILLFQTDPIEFLAGFMAACITRCPIFLGNPNWSIQEWQRVLNLVQPHLVWGMLPIPVQPQAPKFANAHEKGWIMIPTGGSSGQIKFAIHTWETLTASVQGFQDFFEVDHVNSCCVLPLYHVSGLMQFLRSLLTHGRLHITPFTNLLNGESSNAEQAIFLHENSETPQDFFLSLVPTQLQRILQQPHRLSWLRHFHTILLGGAPAWPQTGSLVIKAKSLFWGYYPHSLSETTLNTDDLGYFDGQNHLHIVGRSSRKIISGGENIFPEEVEAALYATGLVKEVYVMGLPDAQWGEAVVALYVPQHLGITIQQLKDDLDSKLSHYKHPKRWLVAAEIPRNAQGKVDLFRLRQMGLS